MHKSISCHPPIRHPPALFSLVNVNCPWQKRYVHFCKFKSLETQPVHEYSASLSPRSPVDLRRRTTEISRRRPPPSTTSFLTRTALFFTSPTTHISLVAAGSAFERHSAQVVGLPLFPLPQAAQRRSYARARKMPPKKTVKEEKIHLGRPGNNLKSGIVCREPKRTPETTSTYMLY
jgi:hypothetical protein